jgi:hypothetical protein
LHREEYPLGHEYGGAEFWTVSPPCIYDDTLISMLEIGQFPMEISPLFHHDLNAWGNS